MEICTENLKERYMCRWKDAIKMDFKGIIWEGLDWVCLAQDT
jgi:hypothetical protein